MMNEMLPKRRSGVTAALKAAAVIASKDCCHKIKLDAIMNSMNPFTAGHIIIIIIIIGMQFCRDVLHFH
jgi:hypothetical protein